MRRSTIRGKKKLSFARGIYTLHVPFLAGRGVFRELHKEIEKFDYPKSTARIEAMFKCVIDLKNFELSYDGAEVTMMRNPLPKKK